MSFASECKRELTEQWADIACSGVSAHYETLRKLSIPAILACIVLKQLPNGTAISPRI